MLIKTPEFIEKFLKDLSQIIFRSKDYKEQLENKLKTVKTSDLNNLILQKRVFSNINFVGSFPTKKYEEILSDIDFIQYIRTFTTDNIKRISQIINQSSNFRFIRFYCGIKKHLQLPWKIDDKGYCTFSLENSYKWLEHIKKYIPEKVYQNVFDILKTQQSLSIKDLIKIEEITQSYISLSWNEKEIENGFKIENDIKYDLLETFQNSDTKNVIKFLYIYDNKNDKINTQKEYCLVDCSLNQSHSDIINFYSYYTNDKKHKFKGLKFHLPENLKDDYREDIKKNIGYLTSLASRLELLLKIQKYNVGNKLISKDDYNKLIQDFMLFARKNNYIIDRNISMLENEKKIQNMIEEKFESLYSIYRPLVKKDSLFDLILYELRGEDGNIQIHKDVIQERIDKGISCPFFNITGNELKKLINIALTVNLDPRQLVKCVYKIAEENKIEPSNIVKEFSDKRFTMYSNTDGTFSIKEKGIIIKEHMNLKDVHVYILFEV
jgi:hypothetical protein